MTDAVITEFAGMRGGPVSRIYQYTREGIRVLDGRRGLKRLYLFDPSSNMMTERDISRQDKVLRRFVFDNYGMLEEAFSFGQPPRTFRYENGGRQIVMREGGDYGAVGKTYTFEPNGIAETAYGRNGEIERVFVFASGSDTVLLRRGGWYGDVERTLVFEGIDTSLFREPEAFLQFLMFTEKSARESEAEIDEQVAKIRGTPAAEPGRSRFAYTGPRHTSDDAGRPAGLPLRVPRYGLSCAPMIVQPGHKAGVLRCRPAIPRMPVSISSLKGILPPGAHQPATLRHATGAAGSRLRNAGRVHSRMAKNLTRVGAAGSLWRSASRAPAMKTGLFLKGGAPGSRSKNVSRVQSRTRKNLHRGEVPKSRMRSARPGEGYRRPPGACGEGKRSPPHIRTIFNRKLLFFAPDIPGKPRHSMQLQ